MKAKQFALFLVAISSVCSSFSPLQAGEVPVVFPNEPKVLADLVDALPQQELGAPTNDTAQWPALTNPKVFYQTNVSPIVWFAPQKFLPPDVKLLQQNNNVGIAYFDNRIFIGWRNASTHFPSADAQMILMSSADWGTTWDFEAKVSVGADLREPFFLDADGRLYFQYFGGGKSNFEFKPQDVWRIERKSAGNWTEPRTVGQKHEVPWDYKKHQNTIFHSSYVGAHYDFVPTQTKNATTKDVHVFYKYSDDAEKWSYLSPPGVSPDPTIPFATRSGGVCEASVEILPPLPQAKSDELVKQGYEPYGRLISVNRNEDGEVVRKGDVKRIGSYLATADIYKHDSRLVMKNYEETYTPFMYDSPRTFSHGEDTYLLARKVVRTFPGEKKETAIPSEWNLNLWVGQTLAGRTPPLLVSKWASAMRAALYEIDTDSREIVLRHTFPSAGDTAFPAVLRIGQNSYLVANYTSPIEEGKDWSWFKGEIGPTDMYFTVIHLEPVSGTYLKLDLKLQRLAGQLAKGCNAKSPHIAKQVSRLFSQVVRAPRSLLNQASVQSFVDLKTYLAKVCKPEGLASYEKMASLTADWMGTDFFTKESEWLRTHGRSEGVSR